ncbi:MAG: ABC transporter substrate-binding protein [Oscillospiraceae bacterium]|nr:ABC transporter substrate-binding protein [Oscillospiraceae bacterium]
MKRIISLILAMGMAATMVACGNSSNNSAPQAAEPTAESAAEQPAPSGQDGGNISAAGVAIDQIILGEDYTDLSAEIRFKTHRTDIMDTILQGYADDFREMYPNITVTYEGITDYSETMTTRLSTPDWGDACMIPTTIPLTELENYFHPFGATATLSEDYNFADNRAFGGTTYGLPSTSNAQGVLFNKAVFAKAGITDIPKTPDEFLDALKKIKDNTDAIPLYTNFAAGWTMGAWDAYISGSATGDPDFMNIKLPHAKDPFANRGDGTGPYAVYYVLYEAVKRGLVEDDPATSDWESSKGMLNRGEIGTMVLGSWAIVQMQEGGPNPDDIGYMSFPISVNGTQYATAGADYCYGINKNSSDEVKLASMLYIKYLVEKSNFDYDQGGIPTVKSHEFPSTLAAFDGIDLVADAPAKAGEEDLFVNINVDSEVSLNMDNQHVISIVEAALTGSATLDDLMADWNARWTASQQKYGAGA